PYVAQLESGTKKNPSLDTLRRLAKALGVTVADIGAEKPAAPSTGIQLGTLRELLLGLAEKKRSEFMKAAEKVGIDREVAAVVWKGATLMKKVR
ncbi:MAG TPA: helix-turn-helix transcriptional regulator, partial [Candidatus Sulfotelmatobacter sp.]|nr:helix-turn-helix transcriptional regulator [Candidatus Sulfotelmatobacter sp.]